MIEELSEYIEKIAQEKESLIARFIFEHGCSPSDVCLVEVKHKNKTVFYADFKSNHESEN